MEELEKIINEINISQDNNVFNFDPLCNELDTIEYHTITSICLKYLLPDVRGSLEVN